MKCVKCSKPVPVRVKDKDWKGWRKSLRSGKWLCPDCYASAKNLCPKCGSKMRIEDYRGYPLTETEAYYQERHTFLYWRCKCGHSEKVKRDG